MNEEITINGIPLEDYQGQTMLDYKIGAPVVENSFFHGVNRTNVVLLKSFVGLREIEITIAFRGRSLHEAKIMRSQFNSQIYGKCEIYIPDDGFFYSCICKNMGEEELIGIGEHSAQIKATYQLQGVRHGALQTVTIQGGGTVYCDGTNPRTDCRLTATASAAAANYRLASATFHNVAAGDVLVFDGIDGKVTKNGVNVAGTTDWMTFPYLYNGANVIRCADPVTVEFYPAYL